MVLYIIGSGLLGYQSLTISGIETISICSRVFLPKSIKYLLPSFTSNGLTIDLCDESDIYDEESVLYSMSSRENIGLLFEGDFAHKNYYFKIKEIAEHKQFSIKVVHNASILNAVGCSGVQLYRFGPSFTVQRLLLEEKSEIFMKIEVNMKRKLHTLIYFDSIGSSSNTDSKQLFSNLMQCEKFPENEFISENTRCIAISIIDNKIRTERVTIKDLAEENYLRMFAFVICSDLHPIEKEAIEKLSFMSKIQRNKDMHTLHLIGLGLGSPKDITVAGKAAVQASQKVYLENYTSIMIGGATDLKLFHEKEIELADREITEQKSDDLINNLEHQDIAYLVVGDPLSATTHTDLLLRVIESEFNVNIINNASIINAACVCGLNPDNFGEIVSIPFWEDRWKPESFFQKIHLNLESSWHTLCLLDIRVKEMSWKNIARGKKTYEPPRFMSASHAAAQLLNIIASRPTVVKVNTKVFGLARVGTELEQIVECSLKELSDMNLGDPLHSLIICAPL